MSDILPQMEKLVVYLDDLCIGSLCWTVRALLTERCVQQCTKEEMRVGDWRAIHMFFNEADADKDFSIWKDEEGHWVGRHCNGCPRLELDDERILFLPPPWSSLNPSAWKTDWLEGSFGNQSSCVNWSEETPCMISIALKQILPQVSRGIQRKCRKAWRWWLWSGSPCAWQVLLLILKMVNLQS